MQQISITDIAGIRIGHAQDREAATGCSVVLGEGGMTAGVDVRGGAPGTRETDLLNPINLVEKIHAVVLAGGSSFGLDAASGVMHYLEERSVGFDAVVAKVPIVCGAVLFDLAVGDYRVRPDGKMGYEACLNAHDAVPCQEGSVGAGTGATVGKILGMDRCMKSGIGVYCVQTGDLKVGAMVAVNCLGDVIDPETGETVAGVLDEKRRGLLNSEEIMIRGFAGRRMEFGGNTTIGVIITNGKLEKSEANKVASMAHNGYGRTMRPAHTMFDGDTIFALATGDVVTDVSVAGLLAARVMERAVVRAVREATPLCGIRCHSELQIP
ncbi:MAG: P1 family peptidase [Deltaproteobacteria bacterium]|nr:P1 family peptidase [Deltaproteobacteria bacterium]